MGLAEGTWTTVLRNDHYVQGKKKKKTRQQILATHPITNETKFTNLQWKRNYMISNLKTSLHKATLFGEVKHSPVKNKCGQFTINSFYTEIYLSNSNLHNIISTLWFLQSQSKAPYQGVSGRFIRLPAPISNLVLLAFSLQLWLLLCSITFVSRLLVSADFPVWPAAVCSCWAQPALPQNRHKTTGTLPETCASTV